MQKILRRTTALFIIVSVAISIGCASQFPSPSNSPYSNTDQAAELDGVAIYDKTFKAHGGDSLDRLGDVNISITGKWKSLIKKIQPVVTDYNFRIDSQERILPGQGVYSAFYQGPGGTKKVVRTPNSIAIYYNDVRSMDTEKLSASALTADAFYFFILGPLALSQWQDQFIRLTDVREKGKTYHRIYLQRKPGFGFSDQDEVVLWVDAENFVTKKVLMTLEGHESTQGAHVETDYLAFHQVDDFLLPVDFFEKVKAPIAIDAHAWNYLGLDINRGLNLADLEGQSYSDKAKAPASEFGE